MNTLNVKYYLMYQMHGLMNSKTKIGYEIPFTRQFYKYTALRSSEEIMDEIKELEVSIAEQLKKVLG